MATVLGPGGYPVSGQSAGGTSTTVQLAANMQQLTPAFSITNKVGVALAANMQQLTPAFNMTNAIPILGGGPVPNRFGSPLAFPFGASPGLNPNHPMTRGIRLAAVAMGSGPAMFDLVQNNIGFVAGGTMLAESNSLGASLYGTAPNNTLGGYAFNALIPSESSTTWTLMWIGKIHANYTCTVVQTSQNTGGTTFLWQSVQAEVAISPSATAASPERGWLSLRHNHPNRPLRLRLCIASH